MTVDVGLEPAPITARWNVVHGLIKVFYGLEWIENMLQDQEDTAQLDEYLLWHVGRLMAYVPVILELLPEKVWGSR